MKKTITITKAEYSALREARMALVYISGVIEDEAKTLLEMSSKLIVIKRKVESTLKEVANG